MDPTINLIIQGLDAASLRQRSIAHNLANINTPGYKRSVVRFEEKLERLLGKSGSVKLFATNPRHFPYPGAKTIEPEVINMVSGTQRQDGNNVNLDIEMSQMVMNTIRYQAMVQQVDERLANLRYVINDGRR